MLPPNLAGTIHHVNRRYLISGSAGPGPPQTPRRLVALGNQPVHGAFLTAKLVDLPQQAGVIAQ